MQTVSFSIADFNSQMMPEEEADEAYLDEEDEIETGQSGGGNTKGAVNQGRTSGGNIKVAPEDSIAPADREELRNEEVCAIMPYSWMLEMQLLIDFSGRRLRQRISLPSQCHRPHSTPFQIWRPPRPAHHRRHWLQHPQRHPPPYVILINQRLRTPARYPREHLRRPTIPTTR